MGKIKLLSSSLDLGLNLIWLSWCHLFKMALSKITKDNFTEDNFTEDDFNRYRITKCEIEAVLQALIALFITLWEKDYPNEPWTNDKASVERFEVKVKNACKIRAASFSDPKKEKQKIKRILAGLKNDGSWYRCEWDISTLSKVLIDCRLFDLEGISVELCDHIKGIADIRNKMAHPTTFGVEEQVFKDTMKSLKKHLEGLRCVISVDRHIHTLEHLESQDKPTSGHQIKDMCHEIEIMKHKCKSYQEKEQILNDREVLQKKNLKLQRKINDQRVLQHEKTTEIKYLKKRIADQQRKIVHLRKKNADLKKDLNENGIFNSIKCTLEHLTKQQTYKLGKTFKLGFSIITLINLGIIIKRTLMHPLLQQHL